MCEVTVILKLEDKTYKEKFLCYEEITTSFDDTYIKEYIEIAKQNMKGDPEEIQIKISMSA